MKILLAEDDKETGSYIQKGLSGEGHTVDLLSDGREALTQAMSQPYDLMILDRMMPGLDGLSLLKSVRAARIETPTILLTAMGSTDDKVEGLRAGADDYMVKPFAFVELLARIDVIARRPALKEEITELVVGDLRLDLLRRELVREGRVQTRTILLETVWGLHFDPKTSVVETHISRLRTKIDKPFEKQHLVTLHGVGYVLQP
jgi:two-component system, OmpR family, response regulator